MKVLETFLYYLVYSMFCCQFKQMARAEERSLLTFAHVSESNVYTAYTPDPSVLISKSFKSKLWMKPDAQSGDFQVVIEFG